jgi:hypothetical protein
MSNAVLDVSPVFERHQCIEVACTRCGDDFNDDFTYHFRSVPEALHALGSDGWIVTQTAVLCWGCLDDADADERASAPAVLAVQRCEYCWPPLFSATTPPDECRCARREVVTHVVQVPFIAGSHHGFTSYCCVTLTCGHCGAGLRDADDESGEPHFDSPESALSAAATSYGWLVTEHLVCCAACAKRRDCAAVGHRWSDARDYVNDELIEHRWCRHCGAPALNPVGDKDMPWL